MYVSVVSVLEDSEVVWVLLLVHEVVVGLFLVHEVVVGLFLVQVFEVAEVN